MHQKGRREVLWSLWWNSLFLMGGCLFLWRRQWHPTPVLLPGESHGWRSLVGYSPRGCEESDTTERLHFDFSLSCIGEGNGNPLQCSCLENPRDRGACWAAVYGVAQSQTWLKWLSSSSSLFLIIYYKWSVMQQKFLIFFFRSFLLLFKLCSSHSCSFLSIPLNISESGIVL